MCKRYHTLLNTAATCWQVPKPALVPLRLFPKQAQGNYKQYTWPMLSSASMANCLYPFGVGMRRVCILSPHCCWFTTRHYPRMPILALSQLLHFIYIILVHSKIDYIVTNLSLPFAGSIWDYDTGMLELNPEECMKGQNSGCLLYPCCCANCCCHLPILANPCHSWPGQCCWW